MLFFSGGLRLVGRWYVGMNEKLLCRDRNQDAQAIILATFKTHNEMIHRRKFYHLRFLMSLTTDRTHCPVHHYLTHQQTSPINNFMFNIVICAWKSFKNKNHLVVAAKSENFHVCRRFESELDLLFTSLRVNFVTAAISMLANYLDKFSCSHLAATIPSSDIF